MPGIAGKKARLQVSPTAGGAGTYTTVAGIRSVSSPLVGGSGDDSEFGIDWEQALQTLKSATISASGSYRPSDTNGQVAIRSAYINDTELWAKVLPDNAVTANAGYKVQVIVTKFEIGEEVDGVSAISIEMKGTGAITLV